MAWKQECHEFYSKNPGRIVTRLDFNRLFAKAWYKTMTAQNIINSFKVTGVYPFNSEAICNAPGMEKREKFTMFKPEALAKRTGLAYIPLYSPSAKPKSYVQPFTCDSSATHQVKTSHESQSLIAKESSVTEDSSSEDLSDHNGAFYSFIPKRTTTSFS